jgi:hypothetical protein
MTMRQGGAIRASTLVGVRKFAGAEFSIGPTVRKIPVGASNCGVDFPKQIPLRPISAVRKSQ